ncbi:MAG: hypothetical protein ABH879_10300 [archaeon]
MRYAQILAERGFSTTEGYLVCMEDPLHWADSDILPPLVMHTGDVVLAVPVGLDSPVFVRDHYYCSRMWASEVHGIDPVTGILPTKIYDQGATLYYESTAALDKYAKYYRVPEYWVIQSTPAESLIRLR